MLQKLKRKEEIAKDLTRVGYKIENGKAKLFRNGNLQATLCTEAVSANIVGDEVQVITNKNRTIVFRCSNGCKVTSF